MLHVTVGEDLMSRNIAMRVQKHRDSLRASGLRPLQIWVPDTRRRGFKKECHRQSLLLQGDSLEQDVLQWIESTADDKGWV